jgi:integrase
MLSDLAAKTTKPTAARQEISDGRGLYLIVQPTGAKSWSYRGRSNGDWIKWKLGDYPIMTPKAARAEAALARAAAQAGRVYRAPQTNAAPEATAVAPDGRSVSEVWEQYRKLRLAAECRETTVSEHCRIFAARIEPVLGRRDIATVSKADCLALADDALARGFSARNKLIALMTAFFGTWCYEQRDLIRADPTRGIEQRTNKEASGSKRALSDAEVKTFWRGCGAIDAANLSSVPFGKMFQLLLLTGCRRGEVSRMKWSEVSGSIWTIPADRTKPGRELRVHLTKTAQTILNSIPRIADCDHVFGVSGATGAFGYSKAKSRLDEAAKIKPWCLHDLRRTFRTGLGKLGVLKEVGERCLNHAQGGLVEIYDQHPYAAEMADAWQRWERHVLKVAR